MAIFSVIFSHISMQIISYTDQLNASNFNVFALFIPTKSQIITILTDNVNLLQVVTPMIAINYI